MIAYTGDLIAKLRNLPKETPVAILLWYDDSLRILEINDVVLDINPSAHSGLPVINMQDPVVFIRYGQYELTRHNGPKAITERMNPTAGEILSKIDHMSYRIPLLVLQQEIDLAMNINGAEEDPEGLKLVIGD